MKRLFELLKLECGDLVTITGGGGKTSLMECLCDELTADYQRVIMTTTTKMCYPQDFKGKIIISPLEEKVICSLSETRPELACFTASKLFNKAKVAGHDVVVVDHIAEHFQKHIILNEGDGSKMKSYKFYRFYEPVIPSKTTHLVHVIGCDLLDCVMTADRIHRCPESDIGHLFDVACFREQMLYFTGEKLKNFTGTKSLLINKADDGNQEKAFRMAEAAQPYFDQIIVASLKERNWCLC